MTKETIHNEFFGELEWIDPAELDEKVYGKDWLPWGWGEDSDGETYDIILIGDSEYRYTKL